VARRGLLAECVINVSEGRDPAIIEALRRAGDPAVLDIHSDPEHHRSVVTLGGPLELIEEAAKQVMASAVSLIDLNHHSGVHPRLGVADVVPFVALPGTPSTTEASTTATARAARSCRNDVLEARDRVAGWAGSRLALPCFVYGPERSLPDIRREAFHPLPPDFGPPRPHPTAGASALGAREVLVAYNVWITSRDHAGSEDGRARALEVARTLAGRLRGPGVRSLGLAFGTGAQVSFNLTDPASVSLPDVYDAVARGAESMACTVLRAELVGLLPADVLGRVPRPRWAELDLSDERTIEARLEATG
jgi:glutamate formiminotransferase / 5-formyltetrahydrofolate cyclo-ligase